MKPNQKISFHACYTVLVYSPYNSNFVLINSLVAHRVAAIMYVCRSIFGILTHVAETQQLCGDELLVKANAQLILRRISINDPELSFAMLTFCSNVSAMLMEGVLQYSRPPARSAKERVWTSFNSLCSSGKFRVEWTKLCTNLDLLYMCFHMEMLYLATMLVISC